jgi:hypothetical protein
MGLILIFGKYWETGERSGFVELPANYRSLTSFGMTRVIGMRWNQ